MPDRRVAEVADIIAEAADITRGLAKVLDLAAKTDVREQVREAARVAESWKARVERAERRLADIDQASATGSGTTTTASDDGELVVRAPDESELYRIPPVPRGGIQFPDATEHPPYQPVAWATEVQLRHGMTRLLQALKDRGDRDPKREVVDQVLALLARGDKALIELDQLVESHDDLSRQVSKLATYIMDEIPGEPSQDEGAVECAIRLLKQWRQDSVTLNSIGYAVAEALGETDEDKPLVANPADLVRRIIGEWQRLGAAVDPSCDPDRRALRLAQENCRLVEALRFTVEYVGTDTLRPRPGWSWFDALSDSAPSLARAFVDRHERVVKPARERDRTAVASARDTDPKLLDQLREMGDRWGALGVALAAAQLTDADALFRQLWADPTDHPAPEAEHRPPLVPGFEDPPPWTDELSEEAVPRWRRLLRWLRFWRRPKACHPVPCPPLQQVNLDVQPAPPRGGSGVSRSAAGR